ncbi:MAG TPA: NAD(P)-dependent oxidoreductase [Candidatus Nanoarchaeia archaeon]|nr:NAD(P)-dependent oxidoreductase [Candidatus Nanoarchaeia archaeon]
MKGKILVTDSLFIFPEHEEILKNAGYEIERLNKPEATEDELASAIQGKIGYILGGIEKVTDKVIEAADDLKVIAFTGSDWKAFITGHETATKRGISIANTPGANSYAVAEYAITLMLGMMRNIFELGRTGTKTFQTTHSLNELTAGIIGMGNVGEIVTTNLKKLGAKKVVYFSRTRKPEIEKQNIEYLNMDEVLSQSDIVFLLIPKSSGENFLGAKEFKLMKDGSLFVNIASRSLVDKDALFHELETSRLRAVQDGKIDKRFDSLPLSIWFNSNESAAYNTLGANKTASDMAVQSIINILESGEDKYKVN